jgi:enoyl-CoA hydratase
MSQILYEKSGGVARITLNRPEKLNALSAEMVVRLADLWAEIGAEPEIRVVLIHGAGDRAFSSGGDLLRLIPIMARTTEPENEWEERLAADRRLLWGAMLRNWTFFKPVIAAVQGIVVAGGLELMLATDLRIAARNATFALTEVRRGLIAGGGSLARLPRQLSWADAMEIALVGEPIDAEHALRIGLVNRVVDPSDLMNAAEEMAAKISRNAPIALAKSKEAMMLGSGRSLAEAFRIESRCSRENGATADAKEGPRAFLENREPVFRGA